MTGFLLLVARPSEPGGTRMIHRGFMMINSSVTFCSRAHSKPAELMKCIPRPHMIHAPK